MLAFLMILSHLGLSELEILINFKETNPMFLRQVLHSLHGHSVHYKDV